MTPQEEVQEFLQDQPFIVQEKEYPHHHAPFVYVARSDVTRVICGTTMKPVTDKGAKSAGRILEEWVKAARVIGTTRLAYLPTTGKEDIFADEPEKDDPLVFVAYYDCGCVAGTFAREGDLAGVAKVVRVWAEEGLWIQTVNKSSIRHRAFCPHKPPEEKQGSFSIKNGKMTVKHIKHTIAPNQEEE